MYYQNLSHHHVVSIACDMSTTVIFLQPVTWYLLITSRYSLPWADCPCWLLTEQEYSPLSVAPSTFRTSSVPLENTLCRRWIGRMSPARCHVTLEMGNPATGQRRNTSRPATTVRFCGTRAEGGPAKCLHRGHWNKGAEHCMWESWTVDSPFICCGSEFL